jgi:hypothetical protein
MFAFANPVTFKYFSLFLVLYLFLIGLSFAFKVLVKRLSKDKRRVCRKSFGTFFESCFWIGLLGLVYLGARRYNVYFLSMEFLHVFNLILLASFAGFGMKKYFKITK